MKYLKLSALVISLGLFFSEAKAQKTQIDLLFIGDVMGHDAQIVSAYDSATQVFGYNEVFAPIQHLMQAPDFTIANLEVTLAGAPYGGYPQFSSPDELAVALKNSGVDVLVTANNHSVDRRKQGILRTIDVLDSLEIQHTGTFKDDVDRAKNNLLLLEKNDIKLGLLNYTYGTNGIPVPAPTVVNLIDTTAMKEDILLAKQQSLDKLIVFLHWGKEYVHLPNKGQKQLAKFLFNQGVDIIIGSHPHVLQPMEIKETATGKQFIAYSLGNFVSNQRTQPRDGGAMVKLTLAKENGKTEIANHGYYLTWVNKTFLPKRAKFEILSTAEVEANEYKGLSDFSRNKMKSFVDSSRVLFQKHNIGVEEIKN
ncbi:CapA family protein [Roseivirga pacifica]